MMGAAEDPESRWPSRCGAAAAVKQRFQPVVLCDPEIMGGTPVFVGTRVPVAAMFDYLAAGDSLDRFLDHFLLCDVDSLAERGTVASEAVEAPDHG